MHTRGEFVDQNFAIFGQEHFNAHRSDMLDSFDRFARDFSGARGGFFRHVRGRFYDVADVVALDGLGERIRNDGAVLAARQHHREFGGEWTKLLDVKRIRVTVQLRPADFNVGSGAQREIAFAVVTVAAFFQNQRPAEFFRRSGDGCAVWRGRKTGQGQTNFSKGAFLQQLVLNGADRRGGRPKWMSKSRESDQTVGIDKFIFQRHHVYHGTKNEERIRVV